MNVIIVNGNTNEAVGKKILAGAQLAAHPETNLRLINPEIGPNTVEGHLDGELSAMAVINELALHQEDADGFIIACFSDPGLRAARELVAKPVLGIAEASMVTALQLGVRFNILSPLKRLRPVLWDIVRGYGLEGRCSGITTVEFPVARAISQDREIYEAFLEAGRCALQKPDTGVLILGGAVLSGLESLLTNSLQVPVLDPIKCAVGQMECMVRLNLKWIGQKRVVPTSL